MKVYIKFDVVSLSFAIFLAAAAGCSDAGRSVTPSMLNDQILHDAPDSAQTASNAHTLWGLWLIGVDPENNTAEIIPVRSAQTHWNVLIWLEKEWCANCLQITSFANSDHGTKLVDIKLRHPFSNDNFTGFDVRGIAMFNGSHVFPISGLNLPDRAMGDGELLDPDGLTTLYNFTTVGQGPGGIQGYLRGKFATATTPDARINGFMRYVSSDAGNTRDAFYAGDSITRTFDIDMPDSPFIMGYAVDASWAPPVNKPVEDPMADFPPEANCPEPYGILVTRDSGGLTDVGGELALRVEVFDHQGKDTYVEPYVECPELFDSGGALVISYVDHFIIIFNNTKHAPPGEYDLLVAVEDNENASSPDWIDLTAYTVYTVTVQEDSGWAATWGGDEWDITTCVTDDFETNIFVGGYFSGTVDFDPGPGEDIHTSVGQSIDAFVSKFDQNGNHIWTATFGASGRDRLLDLTRIRGSYELYIVGSYEGAVDFDPGPDVAVLTSVGGSDAFWVALRTDGTFAYHAESWGGPGDDEATCIDSDHSITAIAGTFEETSQFYSYGSRTSNGGSDVYIFFDSDYFTEVHAFGGSEGDIATDICIINSYPNLALTGAFQDTVDFGIDSPDIRTSNGSRDCFLAYFGAAGYSIQYEWCRTWGGPEPDSANSFTHNINTGYITGSFQGAVNFNGKPGGTPDQKTSSGATDIFITSYDLSSREYLGAVTFGGDSWDSSSAVRIDNDGNVYCGGRFTGSALGLNSNGSYDALLAKFGADLSPITAISWGGIDSDSCSGLYIDAYDRLFVTGGFVDTVDFDPGDGVDNHTSNGGVADAYLMKLLPTLGW